MKRILVIIALVFLFTANSAGLLFGQGFAEKVFQSIVKVRAAIPSDARTAGLLGTQREGSGVIIDRSGLIVTTGYIILESEAIEIQLLDGTFRDAVFVGYDFDTGFGLLRASIPDDVPPIKIGQSSTLASNDPVLAAYYGGQGSARGVYVVARHHFAGYWEYLLEDAIYTSPPIQQYGGASLIGQNGELLGIGSLYTKLSLSGVDATPSNVFIPIDRLKPLLSDLKKTGVLRGSTRPWLGIYLNEVQGHVIVINTAPGGPADRAGIESNNIILEVNNQGIAGMADLYRKLWALGKAGVGVPLSVLQGTKIKTITIHSTNRNQFYETGRNMLTLFLQE